MKDDLTAMPGKFKTSKFGGTVSNFPRTAAFAQVGSLQLRGREYELVSAPNTVTVATGDAVSFMVELSGPSPLEAGEEVTVSFSVKGDLLGTNELGAPRNITFTSDKTRETVSWTPNKTALDASRLVSVDVAVVPSIVSQSEAVMVVGGNASSGVSVVIERTFRVAVVPEEPAHYDIRGVSTAMVELGISDTGAALVSGDDPVVVTFLLSPDNVSGISVTSGDASVVVNGSRLTATLTDTIPTVVFSVGVTDNTLQVTNLQLVVESSVTAVPLRAYYAGDDRVCRDAAACIATVNAAGGRSFLLGVSGGGRRSRWYSAIVFRPVPQRVAGVRNASR